MTAALRVACGRAVHVRTRDGVWLRGGRACLFVLERVGYPRFAKITSRAPFVWAIEFAYRLVAGNRMFFSRLTRRAL